MITVYTFGDSTLDCGHYNDYGVHPGQLIVKNDDFLFPQFQGKDISSLHGPARLEHRAQDGATIRGLPSQVLGLKVEGQALALITVGGNDLLQGLVVDPGPGILAFAVALERLVRELQIRPVFLGNVYDPSFGDDAQNFLGIDPATARANHRRVNDAIATVAGKYGKLVDLHAHFLTGEPSWFTHTIEPSLMGASEVRRVFLAQILPGL